MNSRSRLLLALASAAAVAVFLRRPVRPPRERGTWQPADRQRSRR